MVLIRLDTGLMIITLLLKVYYLKEILAEFTLDDLFAHDFQVEKPIQSLVKRCDIDWLSLDISLVNTLTNVDLLKPLVYNWSIYGAWRLDLGLCHVDIRILISDRVESRDLDHFYVMTRLSLAPPENTSQPVQFDHVLDI